MWRFISRLGRKFTVDKNKCMKCGLCVRLCPNGNILMEEYPAFRDRCQLCLRCVMFCPEHSICVSFLKRNVYRAVDAEELLK